MDQLPDIWRTEVWHPLSVHFPIALLIMATIFKLIAFFIKRELWILGGTVLLLLGTIAAWVSIYTGDLADGIVSRSICDPTVLKEHENNAWIMAWIFTAASVLEISIITRVLKKNLFRFFIIIITITGTVFLLFVGHSGASLVYQQGAGTFKPSPDCSEFN